MAEGARRRQQAHGAVRGPAGLPRDLVTDRLRQRGLGRTEVVRAPEAPGRGATGRPERVTLQGLRQLVEIEVHHADAVAERVVDRVPAPVGHPALVDGAVHAASVSGGATLRPDLGEHPQRAPYAVLMEPPAPVGPAVVGAVDAGDLAMAPLGDDAVGREDRMCVRHRAKDVGGVDPLGQVQRDAILAFGVQPLQVVHPVGDGRAVLRARRAGGSSTPAGRARRRGSRRASVCRTASLDW